MSINDPLRVGSYGIKNSYPKTSDLKEEQLRVYPRDFKTGNVDEWEAINRH